MTQSISQPSNNISHPVRDAFQEWGRKAKVAAAGAYVALPILMASAPAYAHPHPTETPPDSFASYFASSVAEAALGGVVAISGWKLAGFLNNKYNLNTSKMLLIAGGMFAAALGVAYLAYNTPSK